MTDISILPDATGTMTQPFFKKIWSGLPREMFLIILDEIIEDAWASSTAEPLFIHLDTENFWVNPHKIWPELAGDETQYHTLSCDATNHRNRLRRIRTMLHLNQKSRAMVGARFVRLSTGASWELQYPLWMPFMWICPGADVFYAKATELDTVVVDIRRTGEMQHGSVLQHVGNLRVGVDWQTPRLFNDHIADIVKMPGLKSITFAPQNLFAHYYQRGFVERTVPADVALCSLMEHQVGGAVDLWAPIWAKGIRALIDVSDGCRHHNAVGEVFSKSGELRVRLFPRTCDCLQSRVARKSGVQ